MFGGTYVAVLLVYLIWSFLIAYGGRSAVFFSRVYGRFSLCTGVVLLSFFSCIWSFFACLCMEALLLVYGSVATLVWRHACLCMEALLLVRSLLRLYCSHMDSNFALCYGGIIPCVSRHSFACLRRALLLVYIYMEAFFACVKQAFLL